MVAGNQRTFIYQPPRRLLTLDELRQPTFRAYYADKGFRANFFEWAPRKELEARDLEWSACILQGPNPNDYEPRHENGFCVDTIDFGRVGDSVADGRITVMGWDDAFISLACGNYSRSGSERHPTITGTKYEDMNANGRRDAGEPGLANWRIDLYRNGVHVGTTHTDGAGRYAFALDLREHAGRGHGTYEVREADRDGWTAAEKPAPFDVARGSGDQTFAGKDFGNWQPASLAGRKIEDMDADGAGDGDPVLAGWPIHLDDLTTAEAPDAVTVTDADGGYSFAVRPGRTYRVTEALPDPWRASFPTRGGYSRTVLSGDVAGGLDFGNYRPGAVLVQKWNDVNVDGLRDVNELWVPGWTFSLAPLGASCTTSGVDGLCSFVGLDPGTFVVSEVEQDRWRLTAPTTNRQPFRLRSGDRVAAAFGNVCQATIRVRLFDAVGSREHTGLELRVDEIDVPGVIENVPPLTRVGTNDGGVGYLLPGSYRLTLFLPDGVYHPDATFVEGRLALVVERRLTACEDAVVDVEAPLNNGKVTGGMRIDVAERFATAGFEFQARDEGREVHGTLQAIDHQRGLNLHTNEIVGVYVRNPQLAVVIGFVLFDGERRLFMLTLEDRGEPGVADRFSLRISTGYGIGADVVLEGGNVQIHRL